MDPRFERVAAAIPEGFTAMGGLLSRSIEVDLVKLWECGLYWTVLTGPQDVIVNAELNNASIIDACRLSRAATKVFAHNDPRELRIEH